ncbi:hypothetical protein THAOC_23968 [Thalassiosira oceanica]|uniref:Strictosidine synthase conserved region domain-containing protein n=1 Tax=Thalassiosira oceanica TaxID=159749 RepID=K0RR36_THAOC|nr:hypothetical protein THAOC_23968 [Thalassiosira oceanica]|mmetsp:Transcript_6008/g.13559  ORF Transcript_6008/g.13559 Transcript_6008/m.13559 type:complete len:420 (+) Transcript_6008:333-1592(+)|eukprot:EJK56193.1 hypothetical protein THAOC_23968 [Thalassiosira oceanica]
MTLLHAGFVLAPLVLCLAFQIFYEYLLPYGPAVDIPPNRRPTTSDVDTSNESLRLSPRGKLTKIYERFEYDGRVAEPLLIGPETIFFDSSGKMFAINERSNLISITDIRPQDSGNSGDQSVMYGTVKEEAYLGVGRQLSGKFDSRGCLYFSDVIVGLARICNKQGKFGHVEQVCSRVRRGDTWSSVNYVDDIDIDAKSGHVYFTAATDTLVDRHPFSRQWDLLYASKLEGLSGRRTGLLLRYKPETNEVDVLAEDVAFANGVAISREGTHVLYTSTFEARVFKLSLTTGVKEELLVGQLPGLVDGTDCSHRTGLCYAAIPATLPALPKFVMTLPSSFGIIVRTFLLMLPRSLSPKQDPYAAVAEFHPGDLDTAAYVTRLWQDPDGKDISMVTGVTVHGERVYIGTLNGNYIGVLNLRDD